MVDTCGCFSRAKSWHCIKKFLCLWSRKTNGPLLKMRFRGNRWGEIERLWCSSHTTCLPGIPWVHLFQKENPHFFSPFLRSFYMPHLLQVLRCTHFLISKVLHGLSFMCVLQRRIVKNLRGKRDIYTRITTVLHAAQFSRVGNSFFLKCCLRDCPDQCAGYKPQGSHFMI